MRAAGRLFNTIKIFFEVQDYENVIKYSLSSKYPFLANFS